MQPRAVIWGMRLVALKMFGTHFINLSTLCYLFIDRSACINGLSLDAGRELLTLFGRFGSRAGPKI